MSLAFFRPPGLAFFTFQATFFYAKIGPKKRGYPEMPRTATPRTRTRTKQLDEDADRVMGRIPDEPSNGNTDIPGVMPPPGINAKVKTQVEYQTEVDPNTGSPYRRTGAGFPNFGAPEPEPGEGPPEYSPPDELAEFCETWANFAGVNCEVVRLPDPPIRRTPGNGYHRPCFDMERLGGMPFDPANLIGALQMINGGSGGAFRLWLTDSAGAVVQYGPYGAARLDRIVVGDPPRGTNFGGAAAHGPGASVGPYAGTQPPPPEKSDFEKRMEAIQSRMMERMLEQLMNPAPPAPVAAASAMSDEDQAALYLYKKTDFLGSVYSKMAQAAAVATEPPALSWRDRAIDAAVEVAKTNPAIIEAVTSTVERIIGTVLSIFPPPRPAPASEIVYHAPAVRVETPPGSARPQGATVPVPDAPEPEDEDVDEELMEIIQRMIGLLSGTEPLRRDNPLFTELAHKYPVKYYTVIRIVATQPIDEIVDWLINSGPDVCADLLESEATGPHLRNRLKELQALCRQGAKPETNATAASTSAAPNEGV